MNVSLLKTTEDGQVNLGEFQLEDGRIFINAPAENHGFMESMLRQELEGVSAKDDPEAWLEALPERYHGSMLNAVLTEDPEVDVRYTPEARNPKERCDVCAHYSGLDRVCMDERVQLDPSVPEKNDLKIVSPRGWCEEWEKL